ncbi:MAG: DUF4234 domain-containing protein [Firmicutes bacterium]|nr:DUF4234 domain-containing protein [Bacillota bacterium]
MKKRNPGLALLLSLLTCGLYAIYWEIVLVDDVNFVTERRTTSGVMVFLLSILTCGIYWLFWVYQAGVAIDDARAKAGLPATNKGILCLILSIFGLGIIAMMIIQNDVNELA